MSASILYHCFGVMGRGPPNSRIRLVEQVEEFDCSTSTHSPFPGPAVTLFSSGERTCRTRCMLASVEEAKIWARGPGLRTKNLGR